jgi:hypothetical protein
MGAQTLSGAEYGDSGEPEWWRQEFLLGEVAANVTVAAGAGETVSRHFGVLPVLGGEAFTGFTGKPFSLN